MRRFQRRFGGFSQRVEADWGPLEHVLHRRYDEPVVPPSLLDELPQRTTLERAIVTHLKRGGHLYNQTGWIRRPRPSSRGKWLGARIASRGMGSILGARFHDSANGGRG
ncbi:hypothetical protein [Kribbella sp. NPDC049584]|uniref:hypothetical protein n=1 Tax=Kribbella sp. NPDC049584 TaxID=3154833 RepID=UPI00342F7757